MRKYKINMKKTSRASVSIMLSFLMMPVYTFGAALVDGTRISSARTMAESAADISADAGLSDFDSVLQSVYGVFSVSSDEEELKKNLSEYFYSTIENTALTEDDAEGRKYISGIADLFSDPSRMDFDNLINLSVENFNAEFTDGAVLANPDVMKNQITEYMKYTGPLKMSSGILNKLEIFRDFKNQNRAVSAKIDYDRSLERINRLCSEIWENASGYNRFIKEGTFSGASGISDNAERVKEIYRGAVADILKYRALSGKELALSFDCDTEKYIHDLADDAGQREFDVAADMLDRYIIAEDGTEPQFIKTLFSIYSEPDRFIKAVLTDGNIKDFNFVHTFSEVYYREYDKLSDEEKSQRSSQRQRVGYMHNLLRTVTEDAYNGVHEWKSSADRKCTEAADMLAEYCTASDEAAEMLENTRYALEELLSSVDSAEKAGQKWQEAVQKLEDGEVKTSMQNEYSRGISSVNKDDISDYLEITEKNLDAFRKIRSFAESVKFCDRSVCSYFDYTGVYSSLISEVSIGSGENAYQEAQREISEHFEMPDELTETDYCAQDTGYNFYSYLKGLYGNRPASETDKKSARKLLDTVTSLGNPDSASSDIPESVKTDILSYISREKLDAVKAYAAVPDSGDETEFEVNTGGKDPDAVLENQQGTMNSAADFTGKIAELSASAAGEGIEDLLTAEYIMQMFSCYTSDRECSGGKVKDVVPVMLSGVQMNSDNNVFYKSEAEYILWGNEDMEKNHLYTRSLLFGSRFALNSIYAFTDSEIREVTATVAAAIAGWTGFGVPVVKTVLVMSLALAESVIDLRELLSGGSVPVYKNSSSWIVKPSGLINSLRNNSDEIVKNVTDFAGSKTEDIFQKISGAAEGGIDSITGTVNQYVDEFASETADSAVNTVNSIVFSVAQEVIESSDNSLTKEKIKEIIIERIESTDTSGSDISSVILGSLKKAASARADELADVVYRAYKSASGGTAEQIAAAEEAVASGIEGAVNSLRDDIKECVNDLGRSVKETAASGISAAGEYAEEYARDLVGNMVSGAVTELTEQFGSINAPSAASGKAPSPASAVRLTYREYLSMFIMIGTLSESSERAMLSRVAVLMDINMNNGMKNASVNGKKLSPDRKFDISRAHTMVTVDAEVSVGTWFLGAFIPDDRTPDNEAGSGSGIFDKKKIISVRSVLGY